MSYYFKNLKPQYNSEDDSELDEVTQALAGRENGNYGEESSSEDELETLSFGSLKKADTMLQDEETHEKIKGKDKTLQKKKTNEKSFKSKEKQQEAVVDEPKMFVEESFDDDTSSDEGTFFEEDGSDNDEQMGTSNKNGRRKKKNSKHAPTEASAKRPVSKIRKIPGIEVPISRNSNLYQDIRFDKSMGKSEEYDKIRQRYKFLDEYRQREIDELGTMLHDRKFLNKISAREKDELESKFTSMKSKLQTIQNRDLERQIVKGYEGDINKGNKTKYHLKESEKRKVIQKWKFDHMKAKQREKVMERKRKKRLGKEFKQFEFHKR